ncbi:MAG: hypothetical protein JWM99_914 [Verrucomicrobiales bacterium]|jgi:antitoxin (DNA-binding transcriptional repressor) of toxin-antitoxin stability system|nr:hypothetical protein [Verrucomicrobiales bacterium]
MVQQRCDTRWTALSTIPYRRLRLAVLVSNGYVRQYENSHGPGLVKTMKAGQNLLVTDKGEPSFLVTKVGARPRKTRADLDREALEICPASSPVVNFTAVMKEMKKR